jgi:hypothetical protein
MVSSQMLAAIAISILGVASIFYPTNQQPDQKHYDECVLLHPDRYCRIASGFPVEPLDE